MEPKKTFLRNILTTASSITIAAGFSYESGAGGIIRDFAPAPGGLAVVGGTSPAGFVDGADGLRIIANGVIIIGNTAVDVRGIDLGASTSSISIVSNNVSIGSILIGASLANIAVNGKKLTLTGLIPTTAPGNLAANNYSGLGTVTLSNNSSSEIDINTTTPTIFTNNFAVETNEVGIFKVLANSVNNTFRGNIGAIGQAFGAIRILEDTLFQGASMAVKPGGSDGITIASGKTLTINSTLNPVTITGSIEGASTGNGSLLITGTGNDISLPTIGGSAALSNITVSLAPGNSVTFNNNITITGNIDASNGGIGSRMHFLGDVSLTGNTSALILGDDLSYSGNLKVSSSGVNAVGGPTGYGMKLNGHDLTITGNSAITADLILGGVSSLILNGGNVTLKGSTDNTIGNRINFQANNTLTLDASDGARYISGKFESTSGAKTGTLEVTGGGGDITLASSKVGSFIDNNSINKLHFASDATLLLTTSIASPTSGTVIYTPITTYQDGKGTIALNDNYTRFSKDIGAPTGRLKEIHFIAGKFTVERDLSIYAPITGAGTVELDNNLTLSGDAGDNVTPLTAIQLNFSTFTSDSSTAARNIYSPIITSAQYQGSIITKGSNNITFYGPIGDSAGNLTINSINTTPCNIQWCYND